MRDISGIYVATDQELRHDRGHVEIARCAVEGGASIIQLRDKFASDRDFYDWAVEIREITSKHDVLFIVNDRLHIAAAVRADGINIGQNDMPITAARYILDTSVIIGVSCSDMPEAKQAIEDGADYLGFGPVFATVTKMDAAPKTGVELLRDVVEISPLPVVAIGGISQNNLVDVLATGVSSAAVVSAVVCAVDMIQATNNLVAIYKQSKMNS